MECSSSHVINSVKKQNCCLNVPHLETYNSVSYQILLHANLIKVQILIFTENYNKLKGSEKGMALDDSKSQSHLANLKYMFSLSSTNTVFPRQLAVSHKTFGK